MQTVPSDNLLHHVEEIETVYTKNDVNRFLKQGWVLLSVGSGQEQTGQHDYTPSFAYCLGKIKPKNV
ncbi:hypothetical protein B0F87_104124 [Methylobacter tundripaludum]|uniref:Uncharacterized protein n=1 Tax=Methylobacter tundripaludum TaxID=173365 RepID=A0A2S6HEW6_9GAMM|nr:hypothetical protein [Methylobacter tundripaludum]PPK76034.1 hypothetical protein B0F87_104124 [Methylobacter tundripaludum]